MAITEAILNSYVNGDRFRKGMKIRGTEKINLVPLARGEYNINYTFIHPDSGEKYVFRINTASQMHLENQIEYEYKALKILEKSGRTPKVFYVDDKKDMLPYGVLVMQYLKGSPLDYKTDMDKAAMIFADIHKCSTKDADFLLKPADTLGAMLDECRHMAEVYFDSPLADNTVKIIIRRLIDRMEEVHSNQHESGMKPCIINTEVNSGNFIINENPDQCYLVDWEKPILGEAAQDLAHFLAPTTTFWKTDIILSLEEQLNFLMKYASAAGNNCSFDQVRERVFLYLPFNCLRGITWCAMALVQYSSSDKLIRNEDTFKKINDYLSLDYLEMIEQRYFR